MEDKKYLVYTDNTYDKDNDLNVYAKEYDKNADVVLKDIEDDMNKFAKSLEVDTPLLNSYYKGNKMTNQIF